MRGMYHVHIVVLVKVIYDNAVDNEEKIKKKNVEHEYKMKFENVKKIENMKVANECDVITLKANNVDDEIARSATFRTLTTESLLRNVLNTQSGGPNNGFEKSGHRFVGQVILENNTLRVELSNVKIEVSF
jgi:hypothetical protein